MQPIRLILYLLILYFAPAAGLVQARSCRIVSDTLRPDSSLRTNSLAPASVSQADTAGVPVRQQIEKRRPFFQWNGFFKPLIDLDSLGGLILLGVYSVIAAAFGIGLMSSRGTILGPIFYPAGIVAVLIGIVSAVLFAVHLRRRITRRKQLRDRTNRPTNNMQNATH